MPSSKSQSSMWTKKKISSRIQQNNNEVDHQWFLECCLPHSHQHHPSQLSQSWSFQCLHPRWEAERSGVSFDIQILLQSRGCKFSVSKLGIWNIQWFLQRHQHVQLQSSGVEWSLRTWIILGCYWRFVNKEVCKVCIWSVF